jgi:hypothetical protein
VRTITACLFLAVVAAGCRDATVSTTPAPGPGIAVHESPSPFTAITAGDVSGLIPDDWHARPADPGGGFEQGFVASPAPEPRGRLAEGMAAVWIDGTRIGVPSDYYYLAAKRVAVDRLTRTSGCDRLNRQVLVDHRPSYANGGTNSPGDFVALGEGVCRSAQPTRFKYFVAAPGYGPVHRVGIPASGLYVVVAVVPDSPQAPAMLDTLIYGTRFGSAKLSDFVWAAKRGRSL